MEAKNERNSGIMVSVCMITYKHEKFIAEAIEGVLMQKCDFNFELVIGIDASKDKTEEICKEFQKKYPEALLYLDKYVCMCHTYYKSKELRDLD
ncbi:MAG: glycosyltransferase family 2 protein [Bacteroidia bacterium]